MRGCIKWRCFSPGDVVLIEYGGFCCLELKHVGRWESVTRYSCTETGVFLITKIGN